MKFKMKDLFTNNLFLVVLFVFIIRVLFALETGITVFNIGLFYDLSLVIFINTIIIIMTKNNVVQKLVLSILNLFVLSIMVIDTLYYRYFLKFFSRTSFSGFKWLGNGNAEDYDIRFPQYGYISLLLYIALISLLFLNKKRTIVSKNTFFTALILFLIPVISVLFLTNKSYEDRNDYYKSDKFLYDTVFDNVQYSNRFGYYNYHVNDLIGNGFSSIISLIGNGLDKDAEDFDEIYAYFNNREEKQDNEMTNKYMGYNLITILGETLDTRFIHPVLTPNLHKMSNEGMTFTNYFTPVFQQGATCNSEFMSIVGIAPITPSIWGENMCATYENNIYPYSIANQLNHNGYDTYYFHSGFEDFYNRNILIPNYGFDTVKFNNDLERDGINFDLYFDTEIIKFFDEYLDYSKPFYVDMLTYSMHGGYHQTKYRRHNERVNMAFKDEDLPSEIRVYLQKLVEFDNLLGDLLIKLEENNVLDKTLIAIYPDHDLYMMDGDVYHNYINIPDGDNEVHRQKLIIYDGANSNGVKYDNVGSTIDIAPTLLNMLGVDTDYTYFFGKDMFDNDNFVLFPDNTIFDGESWLRLNGDFEGDVNGLERINQALFEKLYEMDIQKKILEIDFFKKLIEQ